RGRARRGAAGGGPGVRTRGGRGAGRASRALSRWGGGDADPVAARRGAQPVDERWNRGVRSAPAAPDRGRLTMRLTRLVAALSLAAAAFAFAAGAAEASVGLTQIAAKDGLGVVTVYYPSTSEAPTITRGPFTFHMAADGTPSP